MIKKWLPTLIFGFVMFVAGLVVLEKSGWGVVLILAGIGVMIFGSVLTMAASGRQKSSYFDNGRLSATNKASDKEAVEIRSENVWDQLEKKQD